MYMIYWRGIKLWLLWPPTCVNLRLMEHSMLTEPSIDTTLNLIAELEGLELMLLTDDEFFEFAFCLYPNTIHCCLMFAGSCHMGMPVRDVKFLSQIQAVFGWAEEWFRKRLIPTSKICSSEKGQVVEKLQDAIEHWKQVSEQSLPRGQKKVLRSSLARGKKLCLMQFKCCPWSCSLCYVYIICTISTLQFNILTHRKRHCTSKPCTLQRRRCQCLWSLLSLGSSFLLCASVCSHLLLEYFLCGAFRVRYSTL
jgi:hypothetical protein